MPFIQRIVDPTHVSRVEVDKSVTNELECVTNHSLANIIRQLSSLSQHAEDMFADLYRETVTFFNRSSELNNRVEHLRIKVTQLNPTEEEGKNGHFINTLFLNNLTKISFHLVNVPLHLMYQGVQHTCKNGNFVLFLGNFNCSGYQTFGLSLRFNQSSVTSINECTCKDFFHILGKILLLKEFGKNDLFFLTLGIFTPMQTILYAPLSH